MMQTVFQSYLLTESKLSQCIIVNRKKKQNRQHIAEPKLREINTSVDLFDFASSRRSHSLEYRHQIKFNAWLYWLSVSEEFLRLRYTG